MPPSPLLASSDVAQDSPAPPRSWMPSTTRAANRSRQHSISTFSANGSPTWTAGRFVGPPSSKVSLASTDTPPMPSPPVRAPNRTTRLPSPLAFARWMSSCRMRAHAERVDQRVALVAGVEDDLAADVRQAQAVAVAADAGDDAGQHAGGVRVVERAEPQRVHHRDRPGAHRHDVPDDAADAGRRALVRLDVRRVVVALDLERDRPAVADVDHAGVLADADEQVLAHLLGGLLAELPQVHLARLVRAVLAPHHAVHRELGRRRAAAEDLVDPAVLVVLAARARGRAARRPASRAPARRCRARRARPR